MTSFGIEPATFRFVAQHCATAISCAMRSELFLADWRTDMTKLLDPLTILRKRLYTNLGYVLT